MIATTVDTVVLCRNEDPRGEQFTHVLLIKRKNDPFEGCWALPGGFLDEGDKNLKQAAARELKEETGLKINQLWQVGAWGSPDRDPRGYTVTIAFFGTVGRPVPVEGADDATEAAWVLLKGLDTKWKLAFDHAEIINRALLRAS